MDEIDPTTYQVVRTFGVGALPQHIVPSWDLKTLWVTNDQGNSLTPIDPVTGVPGTPVHVEDPYNMYYTPDGRYAVVVAEALQRLDFRDPHTMALVHSLPVPCHGVDHMDFSANGTYLIASCEFSGKLLKVDVATQSVVGTLSLGTGAEPQDVKLSPDGKVFYVADLTANGVWEVDGDRFRTLGFIPTGKGAHGLYVSRDAKDLYVSNRGAGTVSLISFASRQVIATWSLPPETGNHPGRGSDIASPDMGGVSADGKVLWLSGRYDSDVYAIDTATGKQLARVRGRLRSPRRVRVATARPILTRSHRHPAMNEITPYGWASTSSRNSANGTSDQQRDDRPGTRFSRRTVLATAGAVVLGGCGVARSARAVTPTSRPQRPVAPSTTMSVPVGPARYVANGSRTENAVALTFHGSGDVTLTQELLASAHQLSAPITVFGVGTWMEANPAVTDAILAGGHTLGNHTYTHPDLGSLDGPAPWPTRSSGAHRCSNISKETTGAGSAPRASSFPPRSSLIKRDSPATRCPSATTSTLSTTKTRVLLPSWPESPKRYAPDPSSACTPVTPERSKPCPLLYS